MKYILSYNKNRVREAIDLCTRWYHGEKVERTPFTFSIPRAGSNAWFNGGLYNFSEMCRSADKAVESLVSVIQYQFDSYPDCDYIPSFPMYYLGEGILAAMYGAEQLLNDGNPPFTKGRLLQNIYEMDKLPAKPDFENSEWGLILKDHIEKLLDASNGDIPICVPDYQSTYGTATKLIPNEELMMAMYDEPEMVHQFFDRITQGIIDFVETMQKWVGDKLLAANVSMPIPGETGIILWDDYVSVLSPELHTEFCQPCNARIFERFGRGHLHTCGPYFPKYINACLACEPVSMDVTIMRGMGKTTDDLIEFRKLTRNHHIRLFGSLSANDISIFNANAAKPSRELYKEFMHGGYFMNAGGTRQEGDEFKQLCFDLSKELISEQKEL